MRCYICDKALNEPSYNSDHQDYDPCDECNTIINELVDGYKDQTTADEDDFNEESPGEQYNLFEEEDYDD